MDFVFTHFISHTDTAVRLERFGRSTVRKGAFFYERGKVLHAFQSSRITLTLTISPIGLERQPQHSRDFMFCLQIPQAAHLLIFLPFQLVLKRSRPYEVMRALVHWKHISAWEKRIAFDVCSRPT